MRFISESSLLEIVKGRNYEQKNLEFKQIGGRTQRIVIQTQRIGGDVEDLIRLA